MGSDNPYSSSQSYAEVSLVSGHPAGLPGDGSRRLERGDGRAARRGRACTCRASRAGPGASSMVRCIYLSLDDLHAGTLDAGTLDAGRLDARRLDARRLDARRRPKSSGSCTERSLVSWQRCRLERSKGDRRARRRGRLRGCGGSTSAATWASACVPSGLSVAGRPDRGCGGRERAGEGGRERGSRDSSYLTLLLTCFLTN